MQATRTTSCPFCGKTLSARTMDVGGTPMFCGFEPCGCPESVADERRREAERRAEEARLEQAERVKRWERAGIPPKFFDADADVTDGLPLLLAGQSLYLQGDNGTGKSTYAACLAKALCDMGRRVRWTSTSRMKSELFSTSWETTEEDLFRRWSAPAFLVIDDIGKECDNRAVVPMIYRVVNERDEQMRPIMVTSNHNRAQLGAKLAECGDESCAKAIVSRLFGMCREPMRFEGEDRRLSWMA